MAALVFKVGALAVKMAAKPLGDRFRNWVMTHPQHRQTVLAVAERMHRFEVMVTRKAEGKQGRAFIGAMTEEKSVELASKLASESFLFVVGSAVIFAEYERSRRKDIRKQHKDAAERQAILDRAKEERERLMEENVQQFKLLEQVVVRLDQVEAALQEMQAAKARRSSWGGFLGPRGLSSSSSGS